MTVDTVRMVKVNESFDEITRFMQARQGDEIEQVMKLMGRTLEGRWGKAT